MLNKDKKDKDKDEDKDKEKDKHKDEVASKMKILPCEHAKQPWCEVSSRIQSEPKFDFSLKISFWQD